MRKTAEYIKVALKERYEKRELDFIVKLIYEQVLQIPYDKIAISQLSDRNTNINNIQLEKIETIIKELRSGKPIQYVLGNCEFYGHRFLVNSHTLIPRPETEELVNLVLKNHPDKKLNVLEIGTGTGCIPISLKIERPDWNIHALDISTGALNTAKGNAILNKVEIQFLEGDILHWTNLNIFSQYQLIISNPPYVLQSEKEFMHEQVLSYEPHLALFVKDDDPLIFYRTILEMSLKHLTSNGNVYFEINESKSDELMDLSTKMNFQNIQFHKDLNNKYRMMHLLKL